MQKDDLKNKIIFKGPKIEPPSNLQELKYRLDKLKGVYLKDICQALDIKMPENSVKAKGFSGQIIEYILGADAKTLPLPDFTNLNIELKTLPVDENLKPLESTFICHANLKPTSYVAFENSTLYHKLKCILFVLIKAPRDVDFSLRQIIGYYFFMPNKDELSIIKEDYEELMDMVMQGNAHKINARFGTIIQMRPKAASGRDITQIIDSNGHIAYTRPRGFYMRRSFTHAMCIKFHNNL